MRPSYRPELPPQPQSYRTQVLDHLGLVAWMFEELGIAEVIDHATQQDPAMRIVTAGHAVKAMVLNGLGFLNQQLYLVPHFFQVSFSEVAFINYVGFPPCCSRLLVILFTTTPLQCASFLLGRVDELFDANPRGHQMNECEKGLAQLLIPRGNASKLFEFVKEPFHLLP
jgi:hypothetical protein